MDRIEHFIVNGSPSPFTPKDPEDRPEDDVQDIGTSYEYIPDWTPHYSWSWEEDETWSWDISVVDIMPGTYTS
jgi:hypothetical protein